MVVVKELAPVLAALGFFAAPVVIYWIKKSHDLRVKELELETNARIHALEVKLAALEGARALQEPQRPELFEAPPQPAVRQR